MSDKVIRYFASLVGMIPWDDASIHRHDPYDNGWVKYKDYIHLAERVKELEAEIERWKHAIETDID